MRSNGSLAINPSQHHTVARRLARIVEKVVERFDRPHQPQQRSSKLVPPEFASVCQLVAQHLEVRNAQVCQKEVGHLRSGLAPGQCGANGSVSYIGRAPLAFAVVARHMRQELARLALKRQHDGRSIVVPLHHHRSHQRILACSASDELQRAGCGTALTGTLDCNTVRKEQVFHALGRVEIRHHHLLAR